MEINADKVIKIVVDNALLYALKTNERLNCTERMILETVLEDQNLIIKELVNKFNDGSGNGKVQAVKELRKIRPYLSLKDALMKINVIWEH